MFVVFSNLQSCLGRIRLKVYQDLCICQNTRRALGLFISSFFHSHRPHMLGVAHFQKRNQRTLTITGHCCLECISRGVCGLHREASPPSGLWQSHMSGLLPPGCIHTPCVSSPRDGWQTVDAQALEGPPHSSTDYCTNPLADHGRWKSRSTGTCRPWIPRGVCACACSDSKMKTVQGKEGPVFLNLTQGFRARVSGNCFLSSLHLHWSIRSYATCENSPNRKHGESVGSLCPATNHAVWIGCFPGAAELVALSRPHPVEV